MVRNSGEEKWELSDSEEEEEEEDEALSLCDLPVILATGENQSRNEDQAFEAKQEEEEDDCKFEFSSWGGSLLTESEMCAAEDVFFQGQILPLRLSVSSDNSFAGIRKDSRNPSRCVSSSESLDHSSSGGFTSMSSSSRSHHSSSSGSSTTTRCKYRERNQFQTHPSPKPQIWVFGDRPENVSSRSRKSAIWDLFRLGLVRMPEIELKDLKLRNKKKSSSSSSSSSSKNRSEEEVNLEKKKRQRLVGKKSGLMSGCKCSASAIGTVSSRIVVSKSSGKNKVRER